MRINQVSWLSVLVGMLFVVGCQLPNSSQSPTPAPSPTTTLEVTPTVTEVTDVDIDFPQQNSLVESPLLVVGRISGTWFFEGQLPARLETTSGEELAQTSLTSTESWMTEEMIPASGELEFVVPEGVTTGVLVIEKDNPSGLPENAESVRIPVRFE